jgi:predicted DCC family thiol-disulfide oxidoreductase YuxK
VGLAAVVKTVDLAALIYVAHRGNLPEALWLPILLLWTSCAVALLVGHRSRLAAGGVAILVAFFIRFGDIYSNHFFLLGVLALYLTVADGGASCSLDAHRRGTTEFVPVWPVRLIQLQVSVVYFYSAIGKLNPDFLSGNVIFYRSNEAMLLPNLDAVAYPILFASLSILTIATELFISISLWIPRLRQIAFGLGLTIHLSMISFITPSPKDILRLMIFALLTLSCYLLFLEPIPRARVVVWDNKCLSCSRWITWFRRLDWLHALRFVALSDSGAVRQDRPLEPLQLRDVDNRVHTGFDAVRRILGVLPVSFLWAPFLGIGVVRYFGDQAYSRAAAARSREVAYAREATATAEPSSRQRRPL